MSLFTKLYEAVHSWRRRRGGSKPSRKRSGPTLEQLDHRQLLAVNFTGIAATDFPVTTTTGVQVITGVPVSQGGNNTVPLIPPALSIPGLVTVSGYQIDQLRVSYTAADDTLNVGVEGPNNTRNGNQVIAGDADNNGNSGTVDPSVTAIDPGLQDPADMGGTETYGISLDFNGDSVPDVVAGFPIGSQFDLSAKPFQVARALAGTPTNLPQFDETQVFPQYTGNYFLANDPSRPNFELQIPNFSQLYQQITGQVFTQTSAVSIGAFASSQQSGGISEEVFAPLPLSIPQITVPVTPPVVCPPVSPPVYINPHQNNHIDSAHNSAVRVNVLGSSGFDPTTIIPSSVRLGVPTTGTTIPTTGAAPIQNFERNVNRDGFPDETFIFNGLDVDLPPGITNAQISGVTTSGQNFTSSVRVFNRDASYFTQAQINAQQARWAKYDAANGIDTSNGIVAPPVKVPAASIQRANSAAINDLYNPFAGVKRPVQVNPGAVNGLSGSGVVAASSVSTTVSIPTKHGKATSKGKRVAASSTPAASTSTLDLALDSTGMPMNMVLAGGA